MSAKQLVAFATTVLVFAFSSIAQDNDIKQVIDKETNSYFKRDADGWRSTWLQDANASRTFVSIFEFDNATGWDSIDAKLTRSFTKNPKPENVEFDNDSFTIRKEGNVAIVDFKRNYKFLDNQAPFDKFATSEHRVLVKSDGNWKIANMISAETSMYRRSNEEMTLNNAGYTLMAANKIDEAIQVFELNTKLYPESYNVWDSLGEAYAKAGKKDLAIQNYEKSIQINPRSESGKKALEDLKK